MRLIALAGKGNSGKSTIACLLVEYLKRGGEHPLVVDADPLGVLSRFLSISPRATLGKIRSEYEVELRRGSGDETRTEFAERAMVAAALHKAPDFDFLAIGHWEWSGSNCVANRVLDLALESIGKRYSTVLLDHEAGVEHIGRFAQHPIDHLLLVANPDPVSIGVVGKVLERCREVDRRVLNTHLVINRVLPGDLTAAPVQLAIGRLKLEPAAILPESDRLREISRAGLSPALLPDSDEWRIRVVDQFDKILSSSNGRGSCTPAREGASV